MREVLLLTKTKKQKGEMRREINLCGDLKKVKMFRKYQLGQ